MAYTARIINITRHSNQGMATVQIGYFTDGSPFKVIEYNISEPDSLKNIVRQQIAQYEKMDALFSAPPSGDLDLTVTPVIPPAPTQAELDEQEWKQDYGTWRRMAVGVNQGLIPSNNAVYVALTSKVRANFKAAYIKYLGA